MTGITITTTNYAVAELNLLGTGNAVTGLTFTASDKSTIYHNLFGSDPETGTTITTTGV